MTYRCGDDGIGPIARRRAAAEQALAKPTGARKIGVARQVELADDVAQQFARLEDIDLAADGLLGRGLRFGPAIRVGTDDGAALNVDQKLGRRSVIGLLHEQEGEGEQDANDGRQHHITRPPHQNSGQL